MSEPLNVRSGGGVAGVYLAALLQGFTLVSYPASSTALMAMHGLSDAQYGSLFLPQVALAVLGAVAGGALAGRVGLRTLLVLALGANAVSQAVLAASTLTGPGTAYALLLAGTGALGLGFGVAGAPLNSYPPLLFPGRANTAVVAMHSALGLGLMGGPLLAGGYTAVGVWIGFPLTLLGASVVLMVLAAVVRLPAGGGTGVVASRGVAARAPRFWLFMGVAVLYAFAEGTFSNWVVIYLQDSKGLPMATAALGLSVFWGALVLGRLGVSALVLRIAPERIWLTLPVLMIGAFLLLPQASGALLGVGLFGLAGLACSAFFPLTIALASRQFDGEVPWVSSMLTAALMIGVGLGSFIVGPLREWLALERLYQVSAMYPLAALIVGASLVRTRRLASATP